MRRISRIWHPMTQHALMGPEIHIERAEGAYLYGKNDRKILDAISSWWVITHGHCHPKIANAVKAQADKLDQVIFAGFTHEPAERLTEKLLRFTDPLLEFVFYSDSGSTAVEAALKMAIGYHTHTGNPRTKIVALEGGYHGDTFGAMSAGARGVFNKLYEPYLFETTHLPFPAPGKEAKTLQVFKDLLKKEGNNVAALILEPLVLGADGMKIYSPETLKSLHDLCKEYGVLLIADEVMTGFGRTGTKFACEQAGIVPDIMCLSKGLTGGFLPMGATMCSRDIYKAFYKEDRAKTFFHSTSFTGNPLSCAAAVANLDLWDTEPVQQNINDITKAHARARGWFEARPDVAGVRTIGTIFALDIPDSTSGYLSSLGPVLYDFYLEHDVLLRPIGNSVYILPPYCVTQADLDLIYDTLWRSLDFIRDEGQQQAA
ncbi:MAG: adenosylmethionine--8-amino-7-oxononanoate transaminase [Alphaproteobacteria bacterium]|nr:adenosylmethionine--8-amino-7-oxononanoate transaminase [Alphaproteobacteria bacterium]